MQRCFVIQPFDAGDFDARYRDVIKPAIEAAGLEAYRTDHDPSVSIPIEAIERGIKDAAVCLADITTNNPNVWFELGYALASDKPVVMICGEARSTPYPFDIQHRSIISYKTGSTSHFDELKKKITEKLKAVLEKEISLEKLSPETIVKAVDGLDPVEMATMACVAQGVSGGSEYVISWYVVKSMERAGYTEFATTVGLKMLQRKGFVTVTTGATPDGDEFLSYRIESAGWDWIIENKDRFELRVRRPKAGTINALGAALGDDIPF